VAIDVGQTYTYSVTATGGTGTLSYTWTTTGLTVVSGCTSTSTTCTVSGSDASYPVSVLIGDQSQGTGNVYPLSSSTLTVYTALTAPAAPTASATSLNANQGLTVTGLIPSTGTSIYSWQWLVSVNGGAYAPATQCAVNSGTGAVGGATETCSVAANTLTAGDTYTFELQVTDSATSPATVTSAPTSVVTVTTSSSSFPWFWVYLGIAIAVIVAVLIALLLVRRRRQSPTAAAPPAQAWQEESAPPTDGGPPMAAPAYLETPKDVGQALPVTTPAMASGAAAATTAPSAATSGPGIDDLMAELDQIGGEVQKRPPKAGTSDMGGKSAQEDDKPS
jgi:hypothetical protein